MLCGCYPYDMGYIELEPTEMMFWMYCPVSVPGMRSMILPDNLKQFIDILIAVREFDPKDFEDSYVYLTAKTLWVSGGYIGNRPGWHIDGFGGEDVNYIWSDRAPTDFLITDQPREVSDDCDKSMIQMANWASMPEMFRCKIVRFPDKHLLRLDPTVIHRSPTNFAAGMRTFVKVSVSQDRYNLVGNSVNHELDEQWPLVHRKLERNHPKQEEIK